ncbi:NAD(P)/FAD-dependent oxidoreductase [Thermostichus vulcanus]|uniref:FAD-binding oxidoreductase n=1 Tax=Thermostichus vulcanus str. 'Rupite' TaxID=2813851 RepID=A0ABT0CE54_THEVL|nr:FAD-dependent oxidoreductase [Thermostichus vulcanus]MCJ2544068.1 FAD-binding oxidoreductase [Thermostichus vulcanus str. 'Rupite']
MIQEGIKERVVTRLNTFLEKALYPPSTYDPALPVGSYWDTTLADLSWRDPAPLQQDVSCDVAILGGGLTGLSAALHLARDHHIQAHLLEAGSLGWGASGRNGGFCGVGASNLSHAGMVKRVGQAETERYYQDQRQAVEGVLALAEAEGFSVDPQGQGCYVVAHRPQSWRELEADHLIYTQVAGYPARLLTAAELREQGFNSQENYGALHIGVGFGLNPLKLTQGLAESARQRGAQLYSRSPVLAWEKVGSWHLWHTAGGVLRAKQVIVATNGYTPEALHPTLQGSLLPVLSNILVTRPLTASEKEAQGWWDPTPLYDTRRLLFYYRLLPDGRLLFGGRGGTRDTPAERQRLRDWMTQRLYTLFPAWQGVEIEHFWNGLACVSRQLHPHIGCSSADPSLWYGLAYHGSGVATAVWAGQKLAQESAGIPAQMSALFRQPLRSFPWPGLRLHYLRLVYRWAQWMEG